MLGRPIMGNKLTLLIVTISLLLSGCAGNNEGNVTISEKPTIQEENIEKNWDESEENVFGVDDYEYSSLSGSEYYWDEEIAVGTKSNGEDHYTVRVYEEVDSENFSKYIQKLSENGFKHAEGYKCEIPDAEMYFNEHSLLKDNSGFKPAGTELEIYYDEHKNILKTRLSNSGSYYIDKLKEFVNQNNENTLDENWLEDSKTLGEKNALASAKQYLAVMAFSYDGLIEQLEYEGYSNSEAVYAANNCGADWNEQAKLMAQNYMSIMPFSKEGLIEQLEFEGFTHEQAVNGVNSTQENNNESNSGSSLGEENALASAKLYLNQMAFSYNGLIEQLEYEGYTNSEAVFAANNCGADWNEQAVMAAENYLSLMPFSKQGLIEQLEYEGFTYEQALYGVTQNGF